jgi:hypothetical protein
MLSFIIAIPVILVAGYVIAMNHHRWRDVGIGTVVGTAVPSLPDADGDDDEVDDSGPSISDGGGGVADID